MVYDLFFLSSSSFLGCLHTLWANICIGISSCPYLPHFALHLHSFSLVLSSLHLSLNSSIHHVCGLPLGLLLLIFIFYNPFGTLCLSILLTCPNHVNLIAMFIELKQIQEFWGLKEVLTKP